MTKAIRIHENGGPEVMRWEDIELPPPGAGEARVRHTAIAVNFSDVNVRRGGFYIAKPQRFPLVPGNEAAGVVAGVGPGVTEVRRGERVAYVGTGGPFYEATGAYAEERNVPADRLVRLPEGISEKIAAAFLLLPARATLTEKRPSPAGPGGSLRGIFSGLGRPIGLALSSAALRELSYASFGYAAVQLVFITYFVSYLALGLGYSLVTAGLVYACAHGAGIVGRIAWGAVADRWLEPRTTLAVLGLISAMCALLAAGFSPAWPLAAVIAVGMLFGASAVGWNGVFLAQVARVAPAGQVSTATGGTQFFTFAGALSGPPLFAAAVWATGSYAWAFGLFALPSAAVALRLLARR